MKTLKLFSLACLVSLSCFAQTDGDNILSNGDFEDTNYKPFTYENGNYVNCPSLIEGWDLRTLAEGESYYTDDFNNKGLAKYNVRGQIVTDSLATDGGSQCLRISRYEWTKAADNPYDGGVQQTVDIVPNATYEFSFLYRLSNHAENGTLVPAWYAVTEIDADGNETVAVKKKKLYNNLDNEWYSKSATFTTSSAAQQVRVSIGVTGGYVYSWGGNIKLWADFDNVKLVQKETTGIAALVAATQVEVFNLEGKHVGYYSSCDDATTALRSQKGVYIVKDSKGGRATKLVIK